MSSNALVPASIAPVSMTSVEDVMKIGQVMAASGFFQDSKQAAQAVVKILAGQELGFGPFASMTGVHIIQGRPAIGANLMAAAVKGSGRYDYRVIRLDDDGCEIAFYEKGQEIGRSAFTREDAKKAQTKNLDKFPRNMYFARAISNGVRWYCPNTFAGAAVYTPEELGAQVNPETGEIIQGEYTVEPEQPKSGNGHKPTATIQPYRDYAAEAAGSAAQFIPAVMGETGWTEEKVKEAAKKLGFTSVGKTKDERRKRFDTLVEYAAHIDGGMPHDLAMAVINEVVTLEDALMDLEMMSKREQQPTGPAEQEPLFDEPMAFTDAYAER